MGWVLFIIVYFLLGLVCAVIAAKIDMADINSDTTDTTPILLMIFCGWPIFIGIAVMAVTIMGIEKGIVWLAKNTPNIKFTAKEK